MENLGLGCRQAGPKSVTFRDCKNSGQMLLLNANYWGTKMPSTAEPVTTPRPDIEQGTKAADELAPTYNVVCWNDPVNLMVYVTHVFMKLFGWQKQKAQKHMLEVHEKGKSVLVREGAEKAEFYVHELQKHKLHATMEPAE